MGENGPRGRPFVSMARMMELLTRMGVHFHTREGKRWWPMRSIPWIGFVVYTERGVVEIDPARRQKGMKLRDVIASLPTQSTLSARAALSTVSFLNFLQRVAPCGCTHLLSG